MSQNLQTDRIGGQGDRDQKLKRIRSSNGVKDKNKIDGGQGWEGGLQ